VARLCQFAVFLGATFSQNVVSSLLPFIDWPLMLQELGGELPKDAVDTAHTAGPVLAKQWSANITLETFGVDGEEPLGSAHMQYYYDAVAQRNRIIADKKVSLLGPNASMHTDQLAMNSSGLNFNATIGKGSNAICKPFHRPYFDMFGLLIAYGKRNGSSNVGNQTCEVWQAAVLNISACIGQNGVPLQFNQSVRGYVSVMTWTDSMLGPPHAQVFMPSSACSSGYPTEPCASNGSSKFDVYRIHSPEEPLSLSNRNVGDALGDMAFTCATKGQGLAGGGDMEGTVVSWWKVEVSLAYGQYAYCLFDHSSRQNLCYGSTGMQVGRESVFGLGRGALQGQCSPNHDVGSWLSFPQAGQCRDGMSIGSDGCTWRAQWIRAVNTSCILHNRSLADSCKKEYGHPPFSRSAAIFERSLVSPDPEKGGCPDVELTIPIFV